MVADLAGEEDRVPRADTRRGELHAGRDDPNPRRVDEDLIAAAATDDLRVAGDDRDAHPRGRGARGLHHAAEILHREPLLEDERERERDRVRAAHGEVVDGPVHRELADVAAGEEDGGDDVRVGRERDTRAASHREDRGVVEPLEGRVPERGDEELLDEAGREQAAAAVADQDPIAGWEWQRARAERSRGHVRGHRFLRARHGRDPRGGGAGGCAPPGCGGWTSSVRRTRARTRRRARRRRGRRTRS